MSSLSLAEDSFLNGPEPAVASKLDAFTRLSDPDRSALAEISRNVRFVEPRNDLVVEGEKPQQVHLVLDGWGCRYKSFADGKRQILAFLIPGDVCDPNANLLKRLDFSIGAITRLKFAVISYDEMRRVIEQRPRIGEALQWNELVEAAIQREWTINVGQRSAYQRLAHLLVELYLRLNSVGLAQDGRCDLPLTQNDLAEATGLTAVHVNRTLQELRGDGLIELERKQLRILDLGRMMDVSAFDPNYLHLDDEGGQLLARR
jgi:CRP-like cAMP-binding protein